MCMRRLHAHREIDRRGMPERSRCLKCGGPVFTNHCSVCGEKLELDRGLAVDHRVNHRYY